MSSIIFVTGGSRSGKSRFAEGLLDEKDDVLYIASGIAFDNEMKRRIEQHRERRNQAWDTLEAYRDFVSLIPGSLAGKSHILFDCVTVMISNLMVVDRSIDWDAADNRIIEGLHAEIQNEVEGFLDAVREFEGKVIVVSNEVGMGLVPDTPLGRHFRDIAGSINQLIALRADEVWFLVSGVPMKIKG